jgi:hypothetical protein
MAAHAHIDEDHESPDVSTGVALLPLFAFAVVVATIAICVVIAVPSVIALIVALGTVIAFAAGIVALLGRLIGRDDH